jgi:hypothetical protein
VFVEQIFGGWFFCWEPQILMYPPRGAPRGGNLTSRQGYSSWSTSHRRSAKFSSILRYHMVCCTRSGTSESSHIRTGIPFLH